MLLLVEKSKTQDLIHEKNIILDPNIKNIHKLNFKFIFDYT